MTSIYAPISATCYPNSASGLSTASPRSHPPARKPLTEKSSDIPRRITAAGRRAYVGLAIRIHSSFQLSNFVTALPLPQAPSLKFSHAKKDTTVAPRGGGWKDANLKTDRRTVAMGRLVVSRCCWIALIYANIKNPFSEPCYGLTPFLGERKSAGSSRRRLKGELKIPPCCAMEVESGNSKGYAIT